MILVELSGMGRGGRSSWRSRRKLSAKYVPPPPMPLLTARSSHARTTLLQKSPPLHGHDCVCAIATGVAVGQGAGVAELLEAFDEVGKEHEGMDPTKFNDDGTYKAGINKVRAV